MNTEQLEVTGGSYRPPRHRRSEPVLPLSVLAYYAVCALYAVRDPTLTLAPLTQIDGAEPQKVWIRLDGYADLFEPPSLFSRLFRRRQDSRRATFVDEELKPAIAMLHDRLGPRDGSAFVPLPIYGFKGMSVYEIQDPMTRISLRVHIHDGWLCIAAAVVRPA